MDSIELKLMCLFFILLLSLKVIVLCLEQSKLDKKREKLLKSLHCSNDKIYEFSLYESIKNFRKDSKECNNNLKSDEALYEELLTDYCDN